MRPEPPERPCNLPPECLRILAAALLALVAISCGTPRAIASPPPSSDAPAYDAPSFVRELARLKTELDDAGKSPDALRSFRASLPKSWAVDVAGHHYDVSASLLDSQLAKAESRPELRAQQVAEAREYLDALAAEAASLSRQPPASTEAARAKLGAILARPEYAHAREQSWWRQIRQRIDEFLLRTLGRILRGAGGQTSLGYALLWIGVCAAAILIVRWIFNRWFRIARMEELAVQSSAMASRSWQEWIFAACDAGARGDYRMAVHCAYWAGIARLQDVGALSPDRAKTPREYLRALGKSKLVHPETLATRQRALSTLTSRLEKSWYGFQIATETDFRDSLIQLETLGCHLP